MKDAVSRRKVMAGALLAPAAALAQSEHTKNPETLVERVLGAKGRREAVHVPQAVDTAPKPVRSCGRCCF